MAMALARHILPHVDEADILRIAPFRVDRARAKALKVGDHSLFVSCGVDDMFDDVLEDDEKADLTGTNRVRKGNRREESWGQGHCLESCKHRERASWRSRWRGRFFEHGGRPSTEDTDEADRSRGFGGEGDGVQAFHPED